MCYAITCTLHMYMRLSEEMQCNTTRGHRTGPVPVRSSAICNLHAHVGIQYTLYIVNQVLNVHVHVYGLQLQM